MKLLDGLAAEKAQAMRLANSIGCSKIHKGASGKWMPCGSHQELQEISKLAEGPKWRTVIPDGKTETRREKRRNRRDWENLTERPLSSIQSLPGGGLISGPASLGITGSGPISMSSADSNTEEKSTSVASSLSGGILRPWTSGSLVRPSAPSTTVGPQYVRENDPDVFTDIESARFRARQIGCIGISRRMSKSGRIVWMPCTNNTDYANRTGSTSLGRRNKKRELERSVRTIISEEAKKRSKRK